jgi:hypothetical protein
LGAIELALKVKLPSPMHKQAVSDEKDLVLAFNTNNFAANLPFHKHDWENRQ